MSGRRAGCPGLQEGPDVRAGGRMSGLEGKTSGCLLSMMPDFRGKGRMSGLWRGAGCPAADAVGRLLVQLLGSCTGAGCPAFGPDVRPL